VYNSFKKEQKNVLSKYININTQKSGQDITMVNYDAHYALRICREKGIAEACVQLSCLLGLWETAVDLALLVSLDLAKQTASQTPDDTELRKKLWLKIGLCTAFRLAEKINY
jgi:vacuolar protein sorting-associated protein 18